MGKRVSGRALKIHRHYTYEQAARALGVSVQTVRAWRDKGLLVLTCEKPHLILGEALKEFLAQRGARKKLALAPHQFYCMTCRSPRNAYGGMADYTPLSPARGKLESLCDACEGTCVRLVGKADLAQLSDHLQITLRTAKGT